jgi:benzoate/toluate 1,2-dioxygenase beta subunit
MLAPTKSVDFELQQEIQQFLFLEAELLDDRRFDEWLALFHPEAEYWVPMAWTQPDPYQHISLFYENVDVLRMRMQRLKELAALSQRPFSRTCHQIGNVRIAEHDGNNLVIRSTALIVEYRRDDQRLFAGHVTHKLRRAVNSFQIDLKRVDLLNCDTEHGHIRMSVPF